MKKRVPQCFFFNKIYSLFFIFVPSCPVREHSNFISFFILFPFHNNQNEEEMEHYKIAGGITTTAEPRPNAYIPDDGTDLPLPKPYGAAAPFKPTEPGSNMRHIRKPVIKPIEI